MGKRLKNERTLLRLGTRYDNTDGLAASLRDCFGKPRTNRGGLLLRAQYDSLTGKVAATLDNVPQEQVSTGAGTVESIEWCHDVGVDEQVAARARPDLHPAGNLPAWRRPDAGNRRLLLAA